MTPTQTVPASEYDALIDLFQLLADSACMGDREEAVRIIERELDNAASMWARRILVFDERAGDLFGEATCS